MRLANDPIDLLVRSRCLMQCEGALDHRGTSRALALVATACALAIPSARGSPRDPARCACAAAEVRRLPAARIHRAGASRDKVDLRARVQGFLGAPVADGDMVKKVKFCS